MSTSTKQNPNKRKTVTTVTHYRMGKNDQWVAEAKTVTEQEYEVETPVERHPITVPGSVPQQPPYWRNPFAPPPFGPIVTC